MSLEDKCEYKKEVVIGRVITLPQCTKPDDWQCPYVGQPFSLYEPGNTQTPLKNIKKCYMK